MEVRLTVPLSSLLLSSPAKEWSERDQRSAVFSMQGKRDNNEDRAVMRTVRMLEDIDKTEVHVWAVMDGHGGQVTKSQ